MQFAMLKSKMLKYMEKVCNRIQQISRRDLILHEPSPFKLKIGKKKINLKLFRFRKALVFLIGFHYQIIIKIFGMHLRLNANGNKCG